MIIFTINYFESRRAAWPEYAAQKDFKTDPDASIFKTMTSVDKVEQCQDLPTVPPSKMENNGPRCRSCTISFKDDISKEDQMSFEDYMIRNKK